MANNINNILIPQVSKITTRKESGNKPVSEQERAEFKNILKGQIDNIREKHGVEVSVHAAKRIQERNLDLDGEEFFKLRDAMERLRDKGGKDSLVITDKGAYIVDVASNKVVTAMDKENMGENVFTKIDSTLIVN